MSVVSFIQRIRSRFGPFVRKLAYAVLILHILLVIFTIGLIKTHSFHADYIYRQLDARLGLSNILHIPEIIGYQFSSSFSEIKNLSITTTPVAAMELEQMRLAAINDEKDFQYVPGEIGMDGEQYEAKIRLKGDREIHFDDPTTTSFRVKLSGSNTIMGMKTFSLHKPRARNYVDEWIYLQMMREEGLVTPRYEFVTLDVNGAERGL